MAGVEDKDLMAYFRRQILLPLLRKPNPADEDSLPSFICLQKQKKEAQLMQKALEKKEEAFKERMEVIACQWRDLHTKKAQLKAYMEASERTLKDNDDKRVHALKRAREERKERMQKEGELLRAKVHLETLKKQHQKLRTEVQKYFIFKKYLEDVVKVSWLEDSQDVTGHYKTLVRMRKDILQSQKRHKEMSEQAQMLLDQHTAEKEVEIQQYKNEGKQFQLRLDEARKGIPQWETCLAEIQDAANKKHLELGNIKMAIFDLFQCLSTHLKGIRNVPKDDSLRQLDMIQQFIEDFAELSMEEKRKDRWKHQREALPTEQ